MNTVDRLRDVGHLDLVGVPVKDVESDRSVQSVAECDRLTQNVIWCDFFAGFVPYAPFIDHQFGLVLWVILAHRIPMRLNHGFGAHALEKYRVPIGTF